MQPWVVVVGGTVLDIHAQSLQHDLRPASTVPGKVHQLPGGVGRNIAEAATTLLSTAVAQQQQQQHRPPSQQQQPQTHPQATQQPHSTKQQQHQSASGSLAQLISAVGDDPAGDALLALCEQRGMAVACIRRCPGEATACVSVINDRSGEVAAAVADVALLEQQLTPTLLQQHQHLLMHTRVLILDANLAPPAMAAACTAAAAGGVPVLFEPVSVPKAVRCVGFLQHLSYITPNVQELLAIAQQVHLNLASSSSSSSRRSREKQQRPVTAEQLQGLPAAQQVAKLAPVLASVLQAGVKGVVLTLGAQGAALVKQGAAGAPSRMLVAHLVPAAPATVVNVNGAGDCLAAGFAAGLALGYAEVEAVAVGVAAGAVAVGSSSNVPTAGEGLCWPRLVDNMRPLLKDVVRMVLPVESAL